VIVLILVGPEYKGRSMGVAHDADLEIAAGHDAVNAVTDEDAWDAPGKTIAIQVERAGDGDTVPTAGTKAF
jgi:hypothetical protein